MAAIVNKAVSIAGQWVEVLAVPSSGISYATVSLAIVNTDSADHSFKVAITTSTGLTPGVIDIIEQGGVLEADGGKYENEYLVLNPGERILMFADGAGLVSCVRGIPKV